MTTSAGPPALAHTGKHPHSSHPCTLVLASLRVPRYLQTVSLVHLSSSELAAVRTRSHLAEVLRCQSHWYSQPSSIQACSLQSLHILSIWPRIHPSSELPRMHTPVSNQNSQPFSTLAADQPITLRHSTYAPPPTRTSSHSQLAPTQTFRHPSSQPTSG